MQHGSYWYQLKIWLYIEILFPFEKFWTPKVSAETILGASFNRVWVKITLLSLPPQDKRIWNRNKRRACLRSYWLTVQKYLSKIVPNHLVYHLSNKRRLRKKEDPLLLSLAEKQILLPWRLCIHLETWAALKTSFSLLPTFHFSRRMLLHITWGGYVEGQLSKFRPPCFDLLKSIDFRIGKSILWIMFPSVIRVDNIFSKGEIIQVN